FKTDGWVRAANFSPEGDKIVIGEGRRARVISLTEKDEEGKPKILAEFNIGREVYAANFSPEGDKIVIGGGYPIGMVTVIGEKE
ncbi:MAG: hypothetical protein ACP5JU_01635, partial [Minisyncoccia bacterium]